MDLTAYLHPGWAPLIRPAPATRPWMDATPDSFAYRCLPLNIANAHGWEVLSPCGFEAVWDGATHPGAVTIRLDPGAEPRTAPVALFGQGVLTFHIDAILRTPPGWNLWIGGSPNRPKDAIAPLTGIVETDWSPFTFTMNWRFTRPGWPLRFEAMEPICFLFPVERAAIERFKPVFAPLDADPATRDRFQAWSAARDAFHQRMRFERPTAPADHWQKHYYRGVDVAGEALIDDHRAKLRLKTFDRSASPQIPVAPSTDVALAAPPPSPAGEIAALKRALARREWLLEAMETQRDLTQAAVAIEARADVSAEEFLERYYATGRPVILEGEMKDWPALTLWTVDYLKTKNGDGLAEDLGFLERFLTPEQEGSAAEISIAPAGAALPLQHLLANRFIAQVVGRQRFRIIPAAEVGKLYEGGDGFSEMADLDDPKLDIARFARLTGAHVYDIDLEAGDILFLPFGWWRQAKALDFSVTATFTNFRWPNDAALTYPAD